MNELHDVFERVVTKVRDLRCYVNGGRLGLLRKSHDLEVFHVIDLGDIEEEEAERVIRDTCVMWLLRKFGTIKLCEIEGSHSVRGDPHTSVFCVATANADINRSIVRPTLAIALLLEVEELASLAKMDMKENNNAL